MTPKQIETLVKMMTERMERESAYQTPEPAVFMLRPYDILNWIAEQNLARPEDIDRWMREQQTSKLPKGF